MARPSAIVLRGSNPFSFAQFAAMDREASSARTRKLLVWEPNQPGLIADLENGRYFETQADGVSA